MHVSLAHGASYHSAASIKQGAFAPSIIFVASAGFKLRSLHAFCLLNGGGSRHVELDLEISKLALERLTAAS